MNIFNDQPILTDKDRKQLGNCLSGWNQLVKSLASLPPTRDEVKKLVLIEMERDEPRPAILQKLVVFLQKEERKIIIGRIRCLKPNLSGL